MEPEAAAVITSMDIEEMDEWSGAAEPARVCAPAAGSVPPGSWCPAAPRGALHYSYSSTALAAAEEDEADEPQTPPHQLSPVVQASMAAWQSATSLLQDLAALQQQDPPGPSVAAYLPLCLLPQQTASPPHLLLTPEQQREPAAGGEAHPAWLTALLALQPLDAHHMQEASSPERTPELRL